jgi:hypothetical protein
MTFGLRPGTLASAAGSVSRRPTAYYLGTTRSATGGKVGVSVDRISSRHAFQCERLGEMSGLVYPEPLLEHSDCEIVLVHSVREVFRLKRLVEQMLSAASCSFRLSIRPRT